MSYLDIVVPLGDEDLVVGVYCRPEAEYVITRVLSQLRLITLAKRKSVYLEGPHKFELYIIYQTNHSGPTTSV